MTNTCEFEGDVSADHDKQQWDKEVVESECVDVESAVSVALLPIEPDVVFDEEGGDEHAVQQVGQGHNQDD